MNHKSGILLFLCSCIPGCGQMYQGYMKRGVSLLGMCCAIIGIASFLNIGELAILLPVVWIYAFFDSYNLRNQPEDNMQSDEYLFGLSDLDSQRLSALCMRRHSIIGWVLVILGIYMLYDTFMRRIMRVISDIPGMEWTYGLVVYDLPRLAITVLVILLGLWFIRGPKQRPSDEIPVFTPPASGSQEETNGEAGQPEEEGSDLGEEAPHGDN